MKVDYGGPHIDSKEGLESIQYSWEIGRSSYLILKRIRIEELSEGETGYHEDIHSPAEIIVCGHLEDKHIQLRQGARH